MSWFRYFFSFRGRLSRSRFWLYYLLAFILQTTYQVLAYTIDYFWNGSWDSGNLGTTEAIIQIILALPFAPVLLISPFAIWAKRLHDLNWSGWWQFVPVLFLIFAFLCIEVWQERANNIALDYLTATGAVGSFALYVWIATQVMAIRGTQGDNRFGPDFLEPKS